jgi:hypothetical protein
MPHRYSKKVSLCIKLTDKKYTERPSPPYSAKECERQIKKGNDGNKWISVSNETGLCKWVKYTKEYKEKLEKRHEEAVEDKRKWDEKRANRKGSKKKRRLSRKLRK